jgi:mannose-6-phosphate isomerase-like protein (cupin superfamily)
MGARMDRRTAMTFQTRMLSERVDEIAPDGSEVRHLCRTANASLVHVTLAPGQVSRAVAHRSVEELWYFVSGRGELWRSLAGREERIDVSAGMSVSLPADTAFQFRASGAEPLAAVCVTIPPWPGDAEAQPAAGLWAE